MQIAGANADAGIGFNNDLVAVGHQLAHAGGHQPDAVFVNLDFLGDADTHVCSG